jgi:hypothetical protein
LRRAPAAAIIRRKKKLNTEFTEAQSSRRRMRKAERRMKLKYVVSGIGCFIAFAVIGALTQPAPECNDCFVSGGFPFRYYRVGGFAGMREYLPGGAIAELAAVIVGTVVIARVWDYLARRNSR